MALRLMLTFFFAKNIFLQDRKRAKTVKKGGNRKKWKSCVTVSGIWDWVGSNSGMGLWHYGRLNVPQFACFLTFPPYREFLMFGPVNRSLHHVVVVVV